MSRSDLLTILKSFRFTVKNLVSHEYGWDDFFSAEILYRDVVFTAIFLFLKNIVCRQVLFSCS